MDRLTEIELFVKIAELSSLSRAAEAMKLANSAASRLLVSLERRLGAQLVQRTTRRLALTETGTSYYDRCKAILADLQEADAAVNASALVPTGTLRVTASLSFCLNHVAPLLRQYTQRYPGVNVQVLAANRYFDLIDNNIDVAIRTRETEVDSNITIRGLARTRRILAASPGYLSRRGTPRKIEDLPRHDMLLYTYSNRHDELVFRRGDETRSLKVKGLLEANDGQVLRAAALDGLSILVQPRYVIHDDIVAGRLVPVLDEWDLPRLQMNIAFQSRRHMSAKVRTFIDFLVAHFERMEYDHKWTVFESGSARPEA
jgi:DNA-binding transcriptional LysR family regulator